MIHHFGGIWKHWIELFKCSCVDKYQFRGALISFLHIEQYSTLEISFILSCEFDTLNQLCLVP